VLLDEGHLTDIRTAAAGALAIKYFAPSQIKAVGIIGTGVQAKQQLLHMQQNNPCKNVWLWGRNTQHAEELKAELGGEYEVKIVATCSEVAQNSDVIITTTPAEQALLLVSDIKPGTLIVAVGSDTQHKQELDSKILQIADLVISDSIPQSKSRGEVYQAVKSSAIDQNDVIELGTALQDTSLQRTNDKQIIVVDLTGVAVQDIMIASAVYSEFIKQ